MFKSGFVTIVGRPNVGKVNINELYNGGKVINSF